MATTEQTFRELTKLPLICGCYYPKPLFYPRNSNSIIISTQDNESNETNKAGVFKYNLDNNDLETLYKYRSDEKVMQHGQFIDYNNGTFHIFATDICMTLNLKTNANMDVTELNRSCDSRPNVFPFLKESNKIHILTSQKEHLTFDLIQKQMDLIEKYGNTEFTNVQRSCFNAMYTPLTNQLMILGGLGSDEIFYCDIDMENENTDRKWPWKLNTHIRMPHSIDNDLCYDSLLFVDVIIVFYFVCGGCNEIWCLDLLGNAWFKSKYSVPKSIATCSYVMKSNTNNDIHLLDFDSQQHFVANIYDLFTKDMIKSRRKYFEVLVMGYIKEQEKSNIIVTNLPFVLKHMILLFFPLFGDGQ